MKIPPNTTHFECTARNGDKLVAPIEFVTDLGPVPEKSLRFGTLRYGTDFISIDEKTNEDTPIVSQTFIEKLPEQVEQTVKQLKSIKKEKGVGICATIDQMLLKKSVKPEIYAKELSKEFPEKTLKQIESTIRARPSHMKLKGLKAKPFLKD